MSRALTESREGNDLENAVAAPRPTRRARRCLNAPGRWDFMISYTRRSPKAALLATELYHSLCKRGYTVWLDVKMKVHDSASMREGAENSKVCIAIITDNGNYS